MTDTHSNPNFKKLTFHKKFCFEIKMILTIDGHFIVQLFIPIQYYVWFSIESIQENRKTIKHSVLTSVFLIIEHLITLSVFFAITSPYTCCIVLAGIEKIVNKHR